MSTFRVHYAGSLTAEHRKDIGFKVVTNKSLNDFWAETELANQHGVYVFTLKRRGPGAAVPFYLGKASRTTFATETLNNRNRRAFTAALLEGEGTPEMYLVVLQRSRGPINHDAIDTLETLLIWIARNRNPALINKRKINTSPGNLMVRFTSNRVVGGTVMDALHHLRDVEVHDETLNMNTTIKLQDIQSNSPKLEIWGLRLDERGACDIKRLEQNLQRWSVC